MQRKSTLLGDHKQATLYQKNKNIFLASPGAGEHCDDELGDHGHVDGHPVALLDPLGFQRVGELADLGQQLAVSDLHNCY